jgi:hypothetical protein
MDQTMCFAVVSARVVFTFPSKWGVFGKRVLVDDLFRGYTVVEYCWYIVDYDHPSTAKTKHQPAGMISQWKGGWINTCFAILPLGGAEQE